VTLKVDQVMKQKLNIKIAFGWVKATSQVMHFSR